MEYVYVEGHGSTVGEEASGDAVGVGQPEGYAVKYEESSQACEGQGEHINHLRREIHAFPVEVRTYAQKSYKEHELP